MNERVFFDCSSSQISLFCVLGQQSGIHELTVMSSIFGAGVSSQNRPSLFGAPAASTQAGASSIFGAAQSTSSLFGGTSQPQQPQQQTGGNVFGSISTTSQPQQTGGNLFGSIGPAAQPQQTQQQQTGGNLFGTLGSTSQAQQQQTNQVQGASLLGASQQPNQSQSGLQQQQQSGAYFDSLLEKSRKRAHGETALEDLPTLQLGLGDLRQRIKRLGRPSVEDKTGDGRAHYLLAGSGVDAGSAVRDLNYFEAQSARAERAPTTLQADTDVESYLANLQTQTTLSMIADGLARSVRDFDTFLEDNVAMEWETQRKRIYEHFGIKAKDVPRMRNAGAFGASGSQEQGGFGRSRRSKAQNQSASRAGATPTKSLFGKSNLQKSVIGTPGPIGKARQLPFGDVDTPTEAGSTIGMDDRFIRERQERYGEKVQALNAARLQQKSFPLLQEFATVEAQSGDQHVEHVVNAYSAVIEMIGEKSDPEDPQVKERQFAEAYLSDERNSPKALEISKMILSGANRHFEKRFFQDLEALVAKNPREANLGGVPDVVSKVKAYIRIRAVRKDLVEDPYTSVLQIVDDDYLWAIIFYLLRSGYVTEAAKYVKNNPAAFRAIDRNFATYITSYSKSSERKLPRELQDRINNEYSQRVRIAPEHSIDPFRMACYKILGRCEIEKRNLEGLKQSMEDWVWLQFNLAREVGRLDEVASEVYGLADVQNTIQEIGARHFSKGGADQSGGVGVYFYLQILAGLFEEAIKYLYTYHYVAGLHFAIGLDYYGLLRVSDLSAPSGELLTHSTRGLSQINFGQMVGHYTRDFRAAKVVTAVDYLTLICLNSDLPEGAGQQQSAQCHEALRELVLESREFAQLLGDVQADGQRIAGAIEERMRLIGLEDSDEFMRTVTIQAASVADDNGRTTDSVLLYHLAGEYDNVVTIINRAESEYIAAEIGEDPTPVVDLGALQQGAAPRLQSSLSLTSIDHPHVLAKYVIELYTSSEMYNTKIESKNQWACALLLQMANAKGLVREQKWTQALDVRIPQNKS